MIDLETKEGLGTIERLEVIRTTTNGERSQAAARAIDKRNRRKELMDMYFPFSIACLIVNKEFNQ